jgi:hypothetical protein
MSRETKLPFEIARAAWRIYIAEGPIVRGVCILQITPQVQINGDGHAHDDQCADTQDQEPPDHPHNRLG